MENFCRKCQNLNPPENRLSLHKFYDTILYSLENFQIVFLIGDCENNLGFEISKVLYTHGWHVDGILGIILQCNQCITSLSTKSSLETDRPNENIIGHGTIYTQKFCSSTKIMYLNEDFFIHELCVDPLLLKYNVIILENIHERRIKTDMLISLLKKVLVKRPTLKLIFTSSSEEINDVKNFFQRTNRNNALIATISTQTHNNAIQIYYRDTPCADYLKEIVSIIMNIDRMRTFGDVLVFLPHKSEVKELRQYLSDTKISEKFSILDCTDNTLYCDKPQRQNRNIILTADNDINGLGCYKIKYVIDCGILKTYWYNSTNGTDSIVFVPISKQIAVQRTRVTKEPTNLTIFRLYTEDNYNSFKKIITPEISRRDLTSVLLVLKTLGVDNLLRFDYISTPSTNLIMSSLETLHALGAIDELGSLVKPLGYFLSHLGLDPLMGKMLYTSTLFSCTEEIITIIAMLQVRSIFSKPSTTDGQKKAILLRRQFEVEQGELITLLNVYSAFIENDKSRDFCSKYFLIYRNLQKVVTFRKQLKYFLVHKYNLVLNTTSKGDIADICKCITSGYFLNAAYLHHSGVYKKIRNKLDLSIHPSSLMCNSKIPYPKILLYCDLITHPKLYMKNITIVENEFLLQFAEHYYKKEKS